MTLSNQTFIEKASDIHKNKYKYIGEYLGSNYKIKIECPIHGVFEQRAADHMRGSGCNKCAGNFKKTNQEFIEQSNIIHNYKYNYIENYINSDTPINIECLEHGIFKQIPYNHLIGQGCAKCAYINNAQLKKTGMNLFISQANLIHDNKYKYY